MMQVKRYVAPTFAEALIQAKNELGTDALIVESKKLRVGGIFGFFRRQMTELTVAIDQPGPNRGARAAAQQAAAAMQPPRPAQPERPVLSPPPEDGATLSNLEREVASLRTAVARLTDRGLEPAAASPLQGNARRLFEALVLRGVDQAAALEIARRVRADDPGALDLFRQELGRLLGPFAPTEIPTGQRRVVALIGPTGVGKTTTLAKLAGRYALERGLKVGLITADTFRIAAIAQLRTYADILGVPVYTVDTPAEVAMAMQQTANCDVVFADTGGCNHRDSKRMQELRNLLAVLRPDETHLVFSLTANPRDTFEAMDHYLPLGVNRLTFTKLDEAVAPGLIVNVRMRCSHPLGYITNGQSVPDDITPADQADFAKILLGA